MADLEELSIRIPSKEAAIADQRLDAFAASAIRADTATNKREAPVDLTDRRLLQLSAPYPA